MRPHLNRRPLPPRKALLAAAAAGALITTAACTPDGSSDESELVWTVPAVQERNSQATVDRWNEQNPERPVRLELLPEDADGQREQMFLELNAGGSSFDILGLDVIWTGEFAENDWLEPLGEELRGEAEELLLPGAVASAVWDDELWAMPYISGSAFLYYRSDLVDEPPTTWDELVEIGQQVAADEDLAIYVGQGAQYEGMVVNYLEYLWGAGGDLYDEDNSQVRFGEDESARTALDFMIDALADDVFAPGYNTMAEEDARNEFQFGNAVFMRNWPYAYPLLQDEEQSEVAGNVGIAPLPTFTGDDTISAVGGLNLAVSAFSEHKEAAREFVRFAATDQAVQLEVAQEYAQVPARAETFDQLTDDPIFEVLAQVVPHARPRPPVPEWNSISTTMQREIFEAYNGDRDPAEAIAAIREALAETTG